MSTINRLPSLLDQRVELTGWVDNVRTSGKIGFVQFRDGTGYVQCVFSKGDVGDATFETVKGLTLEMAVRVAGKVVKDERSPSGVEVQGTACEVLAPSKEYPISNKEHGVDFLMDHRHLWLRSKRQWAVMRVRDTIERATVDFLYENGFLRLDSPILTPNACEGTTELYEVDHFGRPAYLSQSGQLYSEAGIFAHRRVYDFGPVFRAEKSKTRRHLNEFWMMDAEMAFCDFEESMQIQEDLVVFIVERVLLERRAELAMLDRDISALEKVKGPFPRLTHKEAVEKLHTLGSDIHEDEDLGGDDETLLTQEYETPIFVTKYPAIVKAFYMKRDPQDDTRVLCADLLAPEGYGEVIGGSQREDDIEILMNKIRVHDLPLEQFQWYLDLRRYGSVPHSGFGYGLERLVTWMCGTKHVREAIPFPRTLTRLEP
ncbi:asparagine--tRNA ligase [Candidatus Uhrbacteria bacterium RIFCSPHIGHO2_02_FULL_53_13]|uniref:Asparagine--tRNA ligase n=2 Tax=Candidatus Uhriibacteriota TaxID=1752732 RepID=A0A1F7U0G5_9BACT|nr:MAG: asparagine--tRNA ligase [Candidatus Uhrbacteria bacterium RIFCSPHIGHO2_02_FULL_53_13]OGL89098.1 MAG: asparagine--tRNA ligase [Candidatus Uhrbacteria bacterium RIFCSPLOWO2_02_FULL_53_10]